MGNLREYQDHVLADQAGSVEETNGFEPMPTGDYILIAVDGEVKSNTMNAKDPNGKYLKIKFEVATENGSYVGRKIYINYNYININQQTVNIDIGRLKALVRVTNGELAQDQQFSLRHVIDGFNKPFIAKLGINRSTYQGNDYVENTIVKFISNYNALNQPVNNQQQQTGDAKPSWNQ